jgi:alkylation response protein AidB-like acyl-CoA dehydrogenase
MTAMTTDTTRTRDVLDSVRAMAPTIAARAEEIEQRRRLPRDLLDDLIAAGCFRSLASAAVGGVDAALPDHMRMLEALARADGSVGWTVMIGSVAPVILGLLPPTTYDAVYADGSDVILAGAFNPTGRATPVDGGYRVTGRWAFASGCEHADWFFAHCIVDDSRQPPMRMMLLPPDDVEIVDTWSVSGLRGTGSHDFVVSDEFVPDERTFAIFDGPNQEGPLWRIPELSSSTLAIGSVGVGIAQGAVDDVIALASGKTPMLSETTLAANPLFRHQLGRTDARLRAARATLYAEGETAWATAVEGRPFAAEQRARTRATNTWVVETAARVVDACYTAGGGTALYDSSPLQRRLRDAHTLTQHFAVKADTFTLAGAVLAGEDVDTTFL